MGRCENKYKTYINNAIQSSTFISKIDCLKLRIVNGQRESQVKNLKVGKIK